MKKPIPRTLSSLRKSPSTWTSWPIVESSIWHRDHYSSKLGPSRCQVTCQSTHPRVVGVHLFPPKSRSICSHQELQHSEDEHHHQQPLWIKPGMVGAWLERGDWEAKAESWQWTEEGISSKSSVLEPGSNPAFISSHFYCYDVSSVEFLFIRKQSPFMPSIWNLMNFLKFWNLASYFFSHASPCPGHSLRAHITCSLRPPCLLTCH